MILIIKYLQYDEYDMMIKYMIIMKIKHDIIDNYMIIK